MLIFRRDTLMKLTLALLFCGVVCCAGCGTQEDTASSASDADASSLPDSATSGEAIMTAVNAYCPIMGGEVTEEGGLTQWNGKAIGFCCAPCIEEWNELSDEEKEAKLKKYNSGEDAGHDHDHDHGDDEGDGDDESGA
jgi:hypothetical protein